MTRFGSASRSFGANAAPLAPGALLLLVAGLSACREVSPPPVLPPTTEVTADPAIGSLLDARKRDAESRPRAPLAWVALGRAYEANELFPYARACYEQAIALEPRQVEARRRLAAVLLTTGLDHEAMPHLLWLQTEASFEEAEHAVVLWHLAEAQRRLGHVDSALEHAVEAVQRRPELGPARLLAARLHAEREEPQNALELLESIGTPPKGSAWHDALHRLRQQYAEPPAPISLSPTQPPQTQWYDPWATALEADAVGFAQRSRLAEARLQQGDLAAAIQLLRQLRDERPDNQTVLNNLAAAHLGIGDAERAISLLHDEAGKETVGPSTLVNLASALLASGQYQQAHGTAQRARRINPTLAAAFAIEGAALAAVGRHDRAIPLLQRALELAPEDLRASSELARALLHSGRPGEAIRLLRELTSSDPSRGDWHLAQAHCALELQLLEEARSSLERAQRAGVPSPAQLASARERLERLEEAGAS